ncbi:uncharacterized protein SAPINGB_P004869 [Magnusiomyces paraingens]|uniref:Fumarylacetoacetase-like C-terminal domain-containing protein n=1 Tax=Magnusiomyces paraingens TaxID=2606893 RepID=A0A5E8C330_9ASCO|nr:uncharacterized protein SAPINGB_P004869 [Saprochaete ingens]VVT56158.1 unnamed protein product [Saprochaete ingens]
MSFAKNTRKVMCIGRNYVDHIKELGNAPPSQPFFFLKPPSAILPSVAKEPILIPQGTTVHYEVELALVLGKPLKNAQFGGSNSYLDALAGYALAIDLTARNVQNEAKKKGLPWSIAKGFDTFLPLSEFIPKEKISDPHNVTLQLDVNGVTQQKDKTSLMMFKIPEILETVSSIMTLEAGDIILTGTPKGVGPIVPGDKVSCKIYDEADNIIEEGSMDFDVAQKPGPYIFKQT